MPTAPLTKALLNDDFENGLQTEYYQLQTQTPYGLNIASSPKGSGNVLRSELRKGDPTQRSEIRVKDVLVRKFNVLYTFKFSTYIPPNYTPGILVSQWHEQESTGIGPPLALIQTGNTYEIRVNENATDRVRRQTSIVVKPGEWVEWTFQVKWSKNSDGFMKVFSDGKQVFEYNGKNSSQSTPPYFKFGAYKPDWRPFAGQGSNENSDKVVIFYDNFSVVEGIGNPSSNNSSSNKNPSSNNNSTLSAGGGPRCFKWRSGNG